MDLRSKYRVTKTPRMPYLYRSFSEKEPYNYAAQRNPVGFELHRPSIKGTRLLFEGGKDA